MVETKSISYTNSTATLTSAVGGGIESVGNSTSANADYLNSLIKEVILSDETGEGRQLSNWHNHLYAEIFGAIHHMKELPDFDDLFLDSHAAERALNVLGFMKEQMRLIPPRIINQDGEALSFTWDLGDIKRYLTVSDDEVDLMHLSKKLATRCEEVISEGDDLNYETIFSYLSDGSRSTSSSTD